MNAAGVGLILSSVFKMTISIYGISPFPTTTLCIGLLAFTAVDTLKVGFVCVYICVWVRVWMHVHVRARLFNFCDSYLSLSLSFSLALSLSLPLSLILSLSLALPLSLQATRSLEKQCPSSLFQHLSATPEYGFQGNFRWARSRLSELLLVFCHFCHFHTWEEWIWTRILHWLIKSI